MAIGDLFQSRLFRPRNLIPAVFAALFAVVSWFGLQDFLFPDEESALPDASEQAAPAAVEGPPAVPEPTPVYPNVLVARRDIKSGVMLVTELVEWREWVDAIDLNLVVLQDAVPLQAILGAVTRRPYKAGTPVAWDGIITPGGPGFIGAVLAPGMQAVAVEVDRATTSANIIYPGDRVDVIMVTAGEGQQVAAQAIVRDVRVLAVGSTILSMGRYGKVSLTKAGAIEPVQRPAGENYTLEVLPKDAERIALAVSTGRLTLAMRSVAALPAYDEAPTRPVRLSEVLIEPMPPAPPPPPPPVRIIRGGVSEEHVSAET